MLTPVGEMRLVSRGAVFIATLSFGAALGLQPAAAAPAPAARAFTIEQVLSAPFPSSLTAAPQGGRVAWVYNKGGSRNVWVAEPGPNGAYSSRAISAYAGDDGFDLGEVAWAPDGRQVVYSRGGSLEGGGPVNVLSLPTGAVGRRSGSPRWTGPRRGGWGPAIPRPSRRAAMRSPTSWAARSGRRPWRRAASRCS